MKYYDKLTMGFYEENSDNRIEITDEYWQELLNQQTQGGKIQIVDEQVTCVIPSEQELAQQALNRQKAQIQVQIDELDKKRIRAMAEPSIRNDGTAWLDYYTSQIIELRGQL